jgi:hypothetical protein
MVYFSRCRRDFSSFRSRAGKLSASFPEQHGRVAQLAEHSALNRQVVGSIPTASTIQIQQLRAIGNDLKAAKNRPLCPFLCPPHFKMDVIRSHSFSEFWDMVRVGIFPGNLELVKADQFVCANLSPASLSTCTECFRARGSRGHRSRAWQSSDEEKSDGTNSILRGATFESLRSQRRKRRRETLRSREGGNWSLVFTISVKPENSEFEASGKSSMTTWRATVSGIGHRGSRSAHLGVFRDCSVGSRL